MLSPMRRHWKNIPNERIGRRPRSASEAHRAVVADLRRQGWEMSEPDRARRTWRSTGRRIVAGEPVRIVVMGNAAPTITIFGRAESVCSLLAEVGRG